MMGATKSVITLQDFGGLEIAMNDKTLDLNKSGSNFSNTNLTFKVNEIYTNTDLPHGISIENISVMIHNQPLSDKPIPVIDKPEPRVSSPILAKHSPDLLIKLTQYLHRDVVVSPEQTAFNHQQIYHRRALNYDGTWKVENKGDKSLFEFVGPTTFKNPFDSKN